MGHIKIDTTSQINSAITNSKKGVTSESYKIY